ncbi:hypothetical protein [Polaribacter sp. 11A2H]|uniref:hypothetical protein n=1 Tax=Polaribacter sp. 11A2H TaxID=2687290 RepID=UPI00140A4BDC|nr:hypothetical protein [Polaribacter sp. 11A2H]
MDETIIALAPSVYSDIQIQLTLFQQGEKSYINSVNIIFKKKIIKKIKLNGALKENIPENVDSIISSFFSRKLKTFSGSGSSIKKEDKKRASSDLMNKYNI